MLLLPLRRNCTLALDGHEVKQKVTAVITDEAEYNKLSLFLLIYILIYSCIQVDEMINEVKFKEYVITGKYIKAVDLATLIKCK